MADVWMAGPRRDVLYGTGAMYSMSGYVYVVVGAVPVAYPLLEIGYSLELVHPR